VEARRRCEDGKQGEIDIRSCKSKFRKSTLDKASPDSTIDEQGAEANGESKPIEGTMKV